MIKILIADDHAIVREGLKQIVAETTDMVIADEASSGHGVLDKVWNNEYDVVVLDISMPGRDGVDILKQLKNILLPQIFHIYLSQTYLHFLIEMFKSLLLLLKITSGIPKTGRLNIQRS